MNLTNHTDLLAAYTMATDKTGRESVVVVAKGTYGFPVRPNDEPDLLDDQVPLVVCDEFTGDPACSAPLYDIDFAPRKPRCDVLLNGSAYAPKGRQAERVTVSLAVGSVAKSFDVVGKRVWKAGRLFQGASAPEPFVSQPISYDVAFGGVDRTNEDPAKHRWYAANFAGKGYFATTDPKALDGQPLPNTEETGRPITSPGGSYKPMAYGPLGRPWQPRIKWAGTYDQKWLDETAPLLPADFDDCYFQAAPEDQQTDYLGGGEEVVLQNLTPTGRTVFRVPEHLGLSARFVLRNGKKEEAAARVDTLILEPDLGRFLLVWRARLPLRRNPFEVLEIIVDWTGRQSKALQERRRTKMRVPSLAALDREGLRR